jgi:hypothetical protein
MKDTTMSKAKKLLNGALDYSDSLSDDDFESDDAAAVFDSHFGRGERRRRRELQKRRQIEDRLEAGRLRKNLEDWNDWEADWVEP